MGKEPSNTRTQPAREEASAMCCQNQRLVTNPWSSHCFPVYMVCMCVFKFVCVCARVCRGCHQVPSWSALWLEHTAYQLAYLLQDSLPNFHMLGL